MNKSSGKLESPDTDDFASILRRPSDDVRVQYAIGKFMRLIGSEYEQKALSLMLLKSEKFRGSINLQTFGRLMNFSLAAGRPLKFEVNQIEEIETELKSLQPATSARTALILLNYFRKNKMTELQKACLSGVSDTPQILIMAPYSCYSTVLSDGRSIFPLYADWLVNKSGYKTLDQFASATALMMMSGPIGLQNPQDVNALEEINNFISEKAKDLETVMRNDSYTIGLLKGQLGVGSFKGTFAK